MKHNILILSLAFFLASCGGGGSDSNNSSNENTNATDQSAATQQSAANDTATNNTGTENTGNNASSSNGAKLLTTYDCLSCHKEHEKLVGPAYADVAKKYSNTPENVAMLADKVIKGGAGNWGEVPMTAHPSLSKSDAEEMVKYILTIK